MEGYLLDTHIWLWSLIDPDRLPKSLHKILLSDKLPLFLSSVSVWEAVMLGERKRVELIPNPIEWVRENLAESPIQEAPLSHQIVLRSRTLKSALKDPADRFIVATASIYDLTLLSADKEIQKCQDISVRFE